MAVRTPLPSIERPEPTLIPPRVVASAVGNVYEPGLASRTPVDGSIVKLAPTLNPPRTVDEAIGNVYAEGMLGLFRICANPDVASQSD